MNYFALIGDLDKSKNLANRADVQRDLKTAVANINREAGAGSVSPLKLTRGDEIQGLFTDPVCAFDAMVALSDTVSPSRFSWGLGYGELSTDISEDVTMIDGPCFHRAREALDRAKKKKLWFGVEGIEETSSVVLSALMNLMGVIRNRWTAKQALTVREARSVKKQIDVAEGMGKASSTISRALNAAHYAEIVQAENSVRKYLQHLFPGDQ